MLHVLQIKYTEAILSNSTRRLLWFEIIKMLIAVLKKSKFIVLFIIIFGILSFPISARDRNSLVPRKELKQETAEHKKFLNI